MKHSFTEFDSYQKDNLSVLHGEQVFLSKVSILLTE